MTRHIVLLSALWFASPAIAQSDQNVMTTLIAKIHDILSAPDSISSNPHHRSATGASSAERYMVFCSPGIAIDTLDFGRLQTADQVDACSDFSHVVNTVLRPGAAYSPSSGKIWDVYERCIREIELPDANLTVAEQEKLERAERFLRVKQDIVDPFTNSLRSEIRPSEPYKAYNRMFAAYSGAVMQYNDAMKTALTDPTPANVSFWANNGPLLRQNVFNVYSAWGSLGYRDYVEEANGIISGLTGRGPYAAYERLRSKFQLSRKLDMRGNEFWPTFVYPGKVLEPQFNPSWTNFSFSKGEIHEYRDYSSTSFSGGGGFGIGMFTFGSQTTWSNQNEHTEFDASELHVNVKLIQVPLIRGWWQPLIFRSRAWQGVQGGSVGGPGSISSGLPDLQGEMPIVVTAVVLAKDLEVKFNASSDTNTRSHSSFSQSVSVGWGPFSVRGNYATESGSQSHDFEWSRDGIKAPGAQIIAFVCEVLPKAPNPDPTLNWPVDRDEGRVPPVFLNPKSQSFSLEDASKWLAGG